MNALFRGKATAITVAKIRQIETLAGEGKRIFNDEHADWMYFGASIVNCMGHDSCVRKFDEAMPGMFHMLAARTRFFDDEVIKAMSEGVTQLVLLGAGFDMRGYRLPLDDLLAFEVDQPLVQNDKHSRLAKIPNLPRRGEVTLLPVDFNKTTLEEELEKCELYDPNAATVFILEGVTQYIPKEATARTVTAIDKLSGPGSKLLMSYVDADTWADPAQVCGPGYPVEKITDMLSQVKKAGEPWITSFARDGGIDEFLGSCSSLEVQVDTSLDDLSPQYFAPVGRAVDPARMLMTERYVVAMKR